MRHQIAGGRVLKEGEGERLDVRKEIVPEIIFDVP
jgi:hypothetical protein